jgi:coenzyme PQQ synthesis protein D (PqqD)
MPSEGTLSVRSVVRISDDAISSRLADEVVILNLRSGVYHGLEAVGSRVWELVQEPATVISVRDALLDEYDVDPQRCEHDLLALFEELKAHGLVEVGTEAAG